jgi:hypothetical protein
VVEIGKPDRRVPEGDGKVLDFLVWPLQEFPEQTEFVHDFKRRCVDGIAAEIAQEVGMLLQHLNLQAGACQQEAQHHAGRTAADN